MNGRELPDPLPLPAAEVPLVLFVLELLTAAGAAGVTPALLLRFPDEPPTMEAGTRAVAMEDIADDFSFSSLLRAFLERQQQH